MAMWVMNPLSPYLLPFFLTLTHTHTPFGFCCMLVISILHFGFLIWSSPWFRCQ